MPMTWDAAAHAKLFGLLITKQNVKVDCNLLAEFMGPDCTAKAISHQIGKFKKEAGGSANSTPSKPQPATPGSKRSRPMATPRSKNKSKSSRKGDEMQSDPTSSSEDENKDEIKDYSDEEADAGANVSPVKDRSGLRRAMSARPGRFSGMDEDAGQGEESEEEMGGRGPAKKVKIEEAPDIEEARYIGDYV